MAGLLNFIVHIQDRYRILHTESDIDLTEIVTTQLDHGVYSIENLFNTHVDVLFLNMFICPSRIVFDRFVKLFTPTPTDERRIGQSQGHDIYMLSPKSYRNDAPSYACDQAPFYDAEEFNHNLVHEFVHVWEELCSPKGAMDVRPGWFDEGLAMYVSKSYQEQEFKVRLKADYEKSIIPKPDEISSSRSYTWGCILFEFLLKEYGPGKILEIILNTCEQDIISLLDPDTESFSRNYTEFINHRMENDF